MRTSSIKKQLHAVQHTLKNTAKKLPIKKKSKAYLAQIYTMHQAQVVSPTLILQALLEHYRENHCKSPNNKKLVEHLLGKDRQTKSDFVLLVIWRLKNYHTKLEEDELFELLSGFFSLYEIYKIYLTDGLQAKFSTKSYYSSYFVRELEKVKFRLDQDNALVKFTACSLLETLSSSGLLKSVDRAVLSDVMEKMIGLINFKGDKSRDVRSCAIRALVKLKRYVVDTHHPKLCQEILLNLSQFSDEYTCLLLKKFHFLIPKDKQSIVDEFIRSLLPEKSYLANRDLMFEYKFIDNVLSVFHCGSLMLQEEMLPCIFDHIDHYISIVRLNAPQKKDQLIINGFINELLCLRGKTHKNCQAIINEYLVKKTHVNPDFWFEMDLKHVWGYLSPQEKISMVESLSSCIPTNKAALTALSHVYLCLPRVDQFLLLDKLTTTVNQGEINEEKRKTYFITFLAEAREVHACRLKILAQIFPRLITVDKQQFIDEIKILLNDNSANQKLAYQIIEHFRGALPIDIHEALNHSLINKLPRNTKNKKKMKNLSPSDGQENLIKTNKKLTLKMLSMGAGVDENREMKEKNALGLFSEICKLPFVRIVSRVNALKPYLPYLSYPQKVAMINCLMHLDQKTIHHVRLFSLLYKSCRNRVNEYLLLERPFSYYPRAKKHEKPQGVYLPEEVVEHIRSFLC